jgi:hypothetical protein
LQARIGSVGLIVVADRVGQGGDFAIVHVGRGHGDVAQARRAEAAGVFGFLCDARQARVLAIGRPGEAMEGVMG